MIVTVEHSDVIGGTVARWYGTYHEWHDRRAFIEVSLGGVHVHGYFDLFPEGAIDAALEAFHTLRRKHSADMGHLATHEVVMGDLIAIEREPVSAADETVDGGE